MPIVLLKSITTGNSLCGHNLHVCIYMYVLWLVHPVPSYAPCKCFMSGSTVCSLPQSLEVVRAVHVGASTLEERASYLYHNTYFAKLDQWFNFQGPGSVGEKLLDIPIGQVGPEDTIVVTVDLYDVFYTGPGRIADPRLGISDSKGNYNVITIHSSSYLDKWPPCMLFDAIKQENGLVRDGISGSALYKFTFFPEHRYGACESPQDDGYMNIGTFVEKLDLTEPLFFSVYRGEQRTSLYFRYFTVEVITHK